MVPGRPASGRGDDSMTHSQAWGLEIGLPGPAYRSLSCNTRVGGREGTFRASSKLGRPNQTALGSCERQDLNT